MNVEHRTSNVEHRIMYSTIYNKDKAKRLPHSTLDVERSMFDFKLFHLKLRLNVHITLKLCIQVRSSEITVLSGNLYLFNRPPAQSVSVSGLAPDT